jgi:hypothetical protein
LVGLGWGAAVVLGRVVVDVVWEEVRDSGLVVGMEAFLSRLGFVLKISGRISSVKGFSFSTSYSSVTLSKTKSKECRRGRGLGVDFNGNGNGDGRVFVSVISVV